MNIFPVQQTTQQPNFEAIRRIKCSQKEFAHILENYPHAIGGEVREMFKNKSPYHSAVADLIIDTAKKMGQTPEWLKQNCELNGLKFPNLEEAYLYDITGREFVKLGLFKLKGILKIFFYSLKNTGRAQKEVPQHIVPIKVMNDFAEKNMPRFEKFLKKNNVEDVKYEDYDEYMKLVEDFVKKYIENGGKV